MKKPLVVIGWVILCALLLSLAFLIALPSIVSTPKGKNAALHLINRTIDGHLEIDTLKLSWFHEQHIEGFRLFDQKEKKIVSFHAFSTKNSLLSLLLGSHHFKETTLINPTLELIKNPNGKTNVDQVLKVSASKKSKKSLFTTLKKIRGEIKVQNGQFHFQFPNSSPVTLADFNLYLNDRTDDFILTTRTHYLGINGNSATTGHLGPNWKVRAKITGLPTALLDGFTEKTYFSTLLGPHLDINLDATHLDDKVAIFLDIDAQNLNGKVSGFTKEGIFHLDQGSQLEFSFLPQFFAQIVANSNWHLANKTTLLLKIEELSIPLHLKELDFKKIPLKGSVVMERAELSNSQLGNFSLNDFLIKIDTKEELDFIYSGKIASQAGATDLLGTVHIDDHKNIFLDGNFQKFPTELTEVFFKDATLFPQFLGQFFDLSFKGAIKKKQLDIDFNLKSEQCHFEGSCAGPIEKIHLNLNAACKTPIKYTAYIGDHFTATIKTDILYSNHLFALPKIDAHIKSPIVDLEIKGKGGDQQSNLSYRSLSLKAVGTFINPPFAQDLNHASTFEEGSFSLRYEGEKEEIAAKLNLISHDKTREAIDAKLHVEHFLKDESIDFKNATFYVEAEGEHFPVALFNIFLPSDIVWSDLFGSTFNLDLIGHYNGRGSEKKAFLDIKAKGEGLDAKIALSFDGNFKIAQDQPAWIHWEITPKRYNALLHLISSAPKSTYMLSKTATLEMNIVDFVCPKLNASSLNRFFCQSGFVGEFAIYDLEFKESTTQNFLRIPKVSGYIRGSDFSKAIHLSLQGDIEAKTIPANERSHFSFEGEMLEFWTPLGKINRDKMKVKGALALDLIPVDPLLGILSLNPTTRSQTSALLGDFVNARIYGEIQGRSGPLTLDMKSTNFKAILPLNIDHGTLRLKEAVEAQLTLTPAISEIFLKDVNPLILTGAWSDHPIKLYIDPQGFEIPLHPFALEKVVVENIVFDFGQIKVRNGGQIHSLMQFLKATEISDEGVMEAWFTPIYISLKNGVVTYRRFDLLLAKTVHIAFWGSIDIIHDKVNMVLAVSAETIKNRFNISNIAKDDMFQVKMYGSTSNLELDWSAASTRLGILIAGSAGGQIGSIIGGIIEHLSGLGNEVIPPPTTTPFPWTGTK